MEFSFSSGAEKSTSVNSKESGAAAFSLLNNISYSLFTRTLNISDLLNFVIAYKARKLFYVKH
jgi:hypothetical protein